MPYFRNDYYCHLLRKWNIFFYFVRRYTYFCMVFLTRRELKIKFVVRGSLKFLLRGGGASVWRLFTLHSTAFLAPLQKRGGGVLILLFTFSLLQALFFINSSFTLFSVVRSWLFFFRLDFSWLTRKHIIFQNKINTFQQTSSSEFRILRG